MAIQYGLEANTFKNTIVKTIFPSDKQNPSNEQVAAFLTVADQYNLNPFVKEIYAFPGKGGGIIPIVSIDGWNTLINRQPTYDGVEFESHLDKDGNLEAITAKIFRKDRGHPTMVTEYLAECRRGTDPWKSHPSRMLRHKALIQAARYAFGFAGIYDPDEAERIALANNEPPVPIAVISEEQRVHLVKLAQDLDIVEKLGEIVNSFGFEMVAHITVDHYSEVIDAMKVAAVPPTAPVPETTAPADDDDSDAIDGEIVLDDDQSSGTESSTITDDEKAESLLLDQREAARELYRGLKGDAKLKADKFLGTKAINELGADKLTDFTNIFSE